MFASELSSQYSSTWKTSTKSRDNFSADPKTDKKDFLIIEKDGKEFRIIAIN